MDNKAFTITENLMALGIFAVGFAAIATIFPVGAMMQKETTHDVISQQIGRNVHALLMARPYEHTLLDAHQPNDTKVHPPSTVPRGFWKLADRSYAPNSSSLAPIDLFNRRYFWVPLIMRTTLPTGPHDWRVYVFILAKDSANYERGPTTEWATHWADPVEGYISPYWMIPGVRKMAVTVGFADRFDFDNTWEDSLEIHAGDQILDNAGIIRVVEAADAAGITVAGRIVGSPDTIWYGRPAAPGLPSPTRKIIVLSRVTK